MKTTMLFTLVAACLVGCGGSSTDTPDLSTSADLATSTTGDMAGAAVDLAGADLAGGCEPATGTHYALGGASTASKLYRLGDNGWDSEVGRIVVKGSTADIRVDSIASSSSGLVANAGAFIYSLSTTPNPQGLLELTNLPDYTSGGRNTYDFTAVVPQGNNQYLGIYNESVYCLDTSMTYDNGAFVTMGFYNVTGVVGTCPLANTSGIDVTVMGTANGASRVMHFFRIDGTVEAMLLSKSATFMEKMGGLSSGRSISDSGSIYAVSAAEGSTFTKVRDTKLCVDAGNPFNGSKIGGLRSLAW